MMALVCPWQHPLTKICECLGAPYNHERIRGIIPEIATYRPGTFVRGIPGDCENGGFMLDSEKGNKTN